MVKRKKKLREITADLFVASRRQNTSDSVDGDFRVIYSNGGLVWFSGYLVVGWLWMVIYWDLEGFYRDLVMI